MTDVDINSVHSFQAEARSRLLARKGDPLLYADWKQVVFIHFAVSEDVLRPHIPAPLDLDLYDGKAYISLVVLTMCQFRSSHAGLVPWAFGSIHEQKFLNLRTYVHCGNEPGALFLWGWLSRPIRAPLPDTAVGLPYSFASIRYSQDDVSDDLYGIVRKGELEFGYSGRNGPKVILATCAPGSLAEFTMERYTGFFNWNGRPRRFRTWHPAWVQTSAEIEIKATSLILDRFPWFAGAQFVAANFSPGFPGVWLGRPHNLGNPTRKSNERHVLSAFYEMP